MGQPSDTQLPADHARSESSPKTDGTPPQPSSAPTTPQPEQRLSRTMARQAATVSAKLGPVVRRAGDRVAAASPTTLLLALLAVLVTSSIVTALTFDSSLGVAATVLFIPTLSAAVGAIAMRCIDDRRKSQAQHEDAREEARTLDQIEYTLDYVDDKLTIALTQFGTERHNEAVIGMFQAKAATELYLGATGRPNQISSHQAEPESIDLVSQYGLAELLTPHRDGQGTVTGTSTRNSA